MKTTSLGAFQIDDCWAVPYRHHKNKIMWNVTVGGDEGVKSVMACASSVKNAVLNAVRTYKANRTERDMEEEFYGTTG